MIMPRAALNRESEKMRMWSERAFRLSNQGNQAIKLFQRKPLPLQYLSRFDWLKNPLSLKGAMSAGEHAL